MTSDMMAFFDDEVGSDIRRQLFYASASASMSDVERARFYGLPNGCRMREGAKIISPENLVIGENVWIGENAVLDASGGLEIGSHTSIGLGVYLWTHDSHKLNRAECNTADGRDMIKRRPTKIGAKCFIAGPSVVMPGVTIGDGVIIGPMSLVDSDKPENAVYTPYREFLKLDSRILELEAEVQKLKLLVGKN